MIIWIMGMSGAGKTVVGRKVYKDIKKKYKNTVFLDGDTFRKICSNDLGHTIEDRKKNADRFCKLCKFLDEQKINAVCSFLSIFPKSQQWNRKNISNYFEVYLDVPFDELILRDSKGLYKKALNHEISNVVGIDIEFNPPKKPDLIIKNDGTKTIKQTATAILKNIYHKGI